MKLKHYLRQGKPKTKPNCHICKKHGGITHWHHITPIEDQLKMLDNNEIEDDFKNLMVALCPNCHTYLHKLYKMLPQNYEAFFKKLKTNGYSFEENYIFTDLIEKYKGDKSWS
jgi:hypothetical protein